MKTKKLNKTAEARTRKQAFAKAVRNLRAEVKAHTCSPAEAQRRRQSWLDGAPVPE